MATTIECGATECVFNYKRWCSKDRIIIDAPYQDDDDMVCLFKTTKEDMNEGHTD